MLFSTEQHLAAAKLIRRNGAIGDRTDCERFVRMSNTLMVCARLAAKDRGGIRLAGFEWSSVTPDWSVIEKQIGGLKPVNIESPPLVPDDSPLG
jgi:hypothetical protein